MGDTWELLRAGGWPMIPLGICSVTALAVILDRAWALRRSQVIPKDMVYVAGSYRGEASVEASLEACKESNSSLAQVLGALLPVRGLDHDQITDTLNAVGRREVERMEQGLMILEVVAGISPLIGLLGTVLGMVTVFDAINTEGLGDAQVLSAGISKALVTTIAGLGVAIPAVAFHGYYSKRVESMSVEMQEVATQLSTKMSGTTRQKAEPGGTTSAVEI